MSKPYTWEEISEFLKGELKKTKHILTFGAIGSMNVESDIDLVITKKPKSGTSDFYRELHALFDNLNLYMKKKWNAKSVCFFSMLEEQTLRYLKSYNKNDLGFHMMVYFSYPQMEIDWAGAQDANVKKIITEKYICLLGSSEDLLSKKFMKPKIYDPTYNFLFYQDKSNSHYSSELYLAYSKKSFDYLTRKRLKLGTFPLKNVKEIKKVFYKICDEIDRLEATH